MCCDFAEHSSLRVAVSSQDALRFVMLCCLLCIRVRILAALLSVCSCLSLHFIRNGDLLVCARVPVRAFLCYRICHISMWVVGLLIVSYYSLPSSFSSSLLPFRLFALFAVFGYMSLP